MIANIQALRVWLEKLPRIQWHKSRATVHIPETEDFAGISLTIKGLDKQYARWLANYIAAANPATVGAILDELDSLNAAYRFLREEHAKVHERLVRIEGASCAI